MANKLFVGGLPYSTTEDQLRKLFEEAGTVEEVQIIMERELGRSKGFGFVTMASDADAQAAIAKFDGKEFEGRRLSVNIAHPPERRNGGGNGGGFRDNNGGNGGGDRGNRRY